MKRLFIGGPADGTWYDVKDDICKIQHYIPPIIFDEKNIDYKIEYTYYETIRLLDEDLTPCHIMIPVNWNRKGVVKALLEGYRNV